MIGDFGTTPARRVERSMMGLHASKVDIDTWLSARQTDATFARFCAHFVVLEVLFDDVAGLIEVELRSLDGASGLVYERCRALDASVVLMTRLFRWYATKYDQRLDQEKGAVLKAADEVVRSCWWDLFDKAGRQPDTGPLTYLDNCVNAAAVPRTSVPEELRASDDDDLVAPYVRKLPIPIIALPETAEREAWWVVLAAHETAHHVHRDFDRMLEAETEIAITEAVSRVQPACSDDWRPWNREVFADFYSVLMVGSGAAWAITELQHSRPARLFAMPAKAAKYPPPIVRLALLDEVALQIGAENSGGAAQLLSAMDSSERDCVAESDFRRIRQYVTAAPEVARALLALSAFGTLKQWSHATKVATWAQQLIRPEPVFLHQERREAARLMVSAAVTAAKTNSDRTRLHGNLLDILPECGPPGLLGPSEPTTSSTDLISQTRKLAAQLVYLGGVDTA